MTNNPAFTGTPTEVEANTWKRATDATTNTAYGKGCQKQKQEKKLPKPLKKMFAIISPTASRAVRHGW